MLYLAVRGSQADGHRFVADAVQPRRGCGVGRDGAADRACREIVVRDSRRAALVLGAAWYGHPGRCLTLIGVTGTNGKTTTTGLIRHLFNEREIGRDHRYAWAHSMDGTSRSARPPDR